VIKSHGNKLICRIDVTGFVSIQVALLGMFLALHGVIVHYASITVERAKAVHAVWMPEAKQDDAAIIAVTMDGQIYFDTQRMLSAGQLRNQLQQRNWTGKRLFIKADARTRYRNVKEVLEQVRLAGIEKVSFLTGR